MIRSILTENFMMPGYGEYALPEDANKFVCIGGNEKEADFILNAICFCLSGEIFGEFFNSSFLGDKTKPAVVKLITTKGYIARCVSPIKYNQRVIWNGKLESPLTPGCMQALLIPRYDTHLMLFNDSDEYCILKHKSKKFRFKNICNFKDFEEDRRIEEENWERSKRGEEETATKPEQYKIKEIQQCFTYGKGFSKKTGLGPIVLDRDGSCNSWSEKIEPDIPWQMFISKVIEGAPHKLIASYIQNERIKNGKGSK